MTGLIGGNILNKYTINFDGIFLQCPEEIFKVFPKDLDYDTFPDDFCGAGKGLGEKIVPDYIFGLTRFLPFGLDISIKISPACWIHDKDWQLSAPTVQAFTESNDRFHLNIEAIIRAKAKNDWIKARAMYRPVTYMNAVSLAGRYIFWSMKEAQGYEIPYHALDFINPEYVDIISKKIRAGEVLRGNK